MERTAEDEKQLAEWNAKREKARAGGRSRFVAPLRSRVEVPRQRAFGGSRSAMPDLPCDVTSSNNDVRSGKMVICESCQRVLYYNPANEIAVERPSLPT